MSEHLRDRLRDLPPTALPEPPDRLERVFARARARRRRQVAASAVGLLGVVGAGVGVAAQLGGPGVAPSRLATSGPPSPSGVTATTPPPVSSPPTLTPTTSSAPPTTAPTPQPCADGAIVVSLGRQQGAAGTLYQPLEFRNATRTPCTLTGYPGVSFLNAAGSPVGSPARRYDPAGTTPPTVTLAAGARVAAAVGLPETGNFPPASCAPQQVTTVRVYPPGSTIATDLPLATSICTVAANGPFVFAVSTQGG